MLKNVIEFGKKIKNHNSFIFPKNYKFALFKPFQLFLGLFERFSEKQGHDETLTKVPIHSPGHGT